MSSCLIQHGRTTCIASNYVLVRLCICVSDTMDWDYSGQNFLPNVVLSLNMWRCVLDSDWIHEGLSEPENSSIMAMSEEESTVLLLYMSDLLSIQVLQWHSASLAIQLVL